MDKLAILFTLVFLFFFNCHGKDCGSKYFNSNRDSTTVRNSENRPMVEVMPYYPGGNDSLLSFIKRSIKYPDAARKAGIEGLVVISFVVEKDGSLSNFVVEKSVAGIVDDEALRVAKLLGKWTPGQAEGKIVRTRLTLPFRFYLEDCEPVTN